MSAIRAGETEGWPTVTLAEVATLVRGVSYPKTDAREEPAAGYVPVLRATNLQDARLVLDSDLVFIADRNVSPDQLLREGDIVVATSSGSKHLVGKSGQLRAPWHGSFGAFCAAIRPKQSIDARFLALFLQAPAYWRQITKKALGVNINNLRRADLETLQLPLPSRDVQERSVAEIEKQFSRLDEAVANLKRVKANLKRYKAAVLKAAVEGRLVPTEAVLARREGSRFESGAQLLARILEDRRSKSRSAGKHKEPAKPARADGPMLPEGWTWSSLEQLCAVFVDSPHRTPVYGQTGHPALGPRDVVGGELVLGRARLVSEEEFGVQVAKRIPQAGDIVYSRELSLGWGAMLPPGVSVCLSQGMCLFRPAASVSAKYFLSTLNGPFVRDQAKSLATGSAHPHLNISDIKTLTFPLPPLREQVRIVAEIERLSSMVSRIELEVEENLARAQALKQSTLQRAFSSSLSQQTYRRADAGANDG